MTDSEFDLPFFTNFWWMLGLLFVAIVFLHWALVFQWPLSKTAWKRIDYIWISFAIFSLVTAVAESRQMIAKNNLVWVDPLLKSMIKGLRNNAKIQSSETGFCRRLTPEETEKRDYDEACTWIRAVQLDLLNSLAEKIDSTKKIDLRHIDSVPHINDPQLSRMVREIRDEAASYNKGGLQTSFVG
jgi:hypothetical protein